MITQDSPTPAWTTDLRITRNQLLTANQRSHWAERAGRTRTLRILACSVARIDRAPHLQRARIDMTFRFSDSRRRDSGNLHPTAKAIVDGLVDANLLPDDDHTHLDGPHLHIDGTLEPRTTTESSLGLSPVRITITVHDITENAPC